MKKKTKTSARSNTHTWSIVVEQHKHGIPEHSDRLTKNTQPVTQQLALSVCNPIQMWPNVLG